MNKQIEEMAKTLCGEKENDCRKCYSCGGICEFWMESSVLYNAGYRKQSEGEWVKRGNEKTCSLCKFIYYSNNDEWNFCPNCGARMKGDKGE